MDIPDLEDSITESLNQQLERTNSEKFIYDLYTIKSKTPTKPQTRQPHLYHLPSLKKCRRAIWTKLKGPQSLVFLKLIMRLRPNKSFNISSFLLGNEKRLHEHGGKGGRVKKSKRRAEANLISKVANVYLPTVEFTENLMHALGLLAKNVYCYFLVFGLNNVTYHNLNSLNALLSQ